MPLVHLDDLPLLDLYGSGEGPDRFMNRPDLSERERSAVEFFRWSQTETDKVPNMDKLLAAVDGADRLRAIARRR